MNTIDKKENLKDDENEFLWLHLMIRYYAQLRFPNNVYMTFVTMYKNGVTACYGSKI
ncbi:hypothetical protein XIS1_890062 [Xenorhabdus innexi]|uniref:Uncharacterized protein n=1 Tax=Xenorhabdus innexi TaxID=290109 RepID=A0A1N6N1K2_9GAMM|nr:hypothetical protein XIS1_890062 [Xenorhabdus innexi]